MIVAHVRDVSDTVIAALCVGAHTSMISLDDLVGKLGPSLCLAADCLSLRLDGQAEEIAHGV